jgi:primosomal protein N' (replication factor Y) (superfamily II helicase)
MTNQIRQIEILLPLNVPMAFTYALPNGVGAGIGDFVVVPFGRKTEIGVIWKDATKILPDEKVKQVIKKIEIPPLSTNFRKFIDWVAAYTMSPAGMVLKMVLSTPDAFVAEKDIVLYKRHCKEVESCSSPSLEREKVREGCGKNVSSSNKNIISKPRQSILTVLADDPLTLADLREKSGSSSVTIKKMVKDGLIEEIKHPPLYHPEEVRLANIHLSDNQQNVVNDLKDKITANKFSATLLDGVTGSGKTEVYLSAIEELFKDESAQILIMLPEIALTSQVVNRFERRFGFTPQTWHSGMTKSQKEKTWRKVNNGGTRLIIGARSALFLPYKNLKLIIVDEEHDNSYKQEEGVIYNARDMAVLRAKTEGFPIILASATPSIETMENVQSGKYELLHIPNRHGGAQMPDVDIIDMRTQKLDSKHFISRPLIEAIRKNIENGRQSLLFMNRRGYAPLVLCRTCGYRFKCEECSTWLVKHKYGAHFMCHHCGYRRPEPKTCPECESEDSLVSCGPGVERIEEEVREYFPDSNIALMASDSLTHKKMAELLDDILSNKIDIIIGTQVIAKGHHFPNLNLVGVIDGNLGLEGGDLRASERTYQLLHQVAGRAGREGRKGKVILQSYMPGNAVMQALKGWDRDGFVGAEMLSRNANSMPPFTRFAALIISGVEEAAVSALARNIVNAAPRSNDVRVLGPVPAPIFMLRGKFRYRILIKTARNINLQNFIRQMLGGVKVSSSVKVKIDIDPYNFL